MIARLLSIVYVIYCFEVGFFLILFPWFGIWENNVVINRYPMLRAVMLSGYLKGAITGLGLTNLILGAMEIGHLRRSSRRRISD